MINFRKIKDILEKIELNQKSLSEDLKTKLDLFLNIIFFNLKIPKNNSELKKYLYIEKHGTNIFSTKITFRLHFFTFGKNEIIHQI